jgi:hypothetical protein
MINKQGEAHTIFHIGHILKTREVNTLRLSAAVEAAGHYIALRQADEQSQEARGIFPQGEMLVKAP